MVFRDTTTTADSITHYADFLLGLTDGETTQYPLAARARSANTWKYIVATWFWQNSDMWQFDDSEYTTYPEATTTLVNSRNDYILPTTALIIERVEVRDANATETWHKLIPVDEKDISGSLQDFQDIDGLPKYYRIIGRSLWLYPAPDNGVSVTLSAGLRIYFKREISEMTATTTTTEIGFGEPWDRAVAYGMAYDFALARGMDVTNDLYIQIYGGVKNGQKIDGFQQMVEKQSSSRADDKPTRIIPRSSISNKIQYT